MSDDWEVIEGSLDAQQELFADEVKDPWWPFTNIGTNNEQDNRGV